MASTTTKTDSRGAGRQSRDTTSGERFSLRLESQARGEVGQGRCIAFAESWVAAFKEELWDAISEQLEQGNQS